jgi:amino acid permease
MSVFGYIGFFGYLMLVPIFTEGDTGYICQALGFPSWLKISIAVAAGVVLFVLMKNLMRYFVEMGSEEIIENKRSRAIFIRSLILYPLLIGIVITTLLNLPVPLFLSLISPICGPFSIMWAYGFALYKKYPAIHANRKFDEFTRMNPWLFVFLFGIIVVNRLLVSGIYAS